MKFLFSALLVLGGFAGGLSVESFIKFKDGDFVKNPAVYFEIPVTDMSRAKKFYSAVFGYDFQMEVIHGNEMALFPFFDGVPGASGALAKGAIYKPTRDGSLVYLFSGDLELTLSKAAAAGGKVLFPKTSAGEFGFVAEIEDSEGNRIGISQP